MTKPILVVDDDQMMRRSLAFNLEHAGYQVQTAESAEAALAMVRANPPLLILMDIGLPGMDGLEALRQLHGQFPLILVTARQRHFDEVLGLEMGADDYITKPFEFDVLLARIRTVLRRVQPPKPTPMMPTALTVGDLTINPLSHTVFIGGRAIHLAPREFRLLYILAQAPGQVISLEDLLTRAWGAEYAGEPQVIYVHIRSLREKIETTPERPARIVTIRGVGYKLLPQEV